MDNRYLANEAIKTSMLLPVLVLLSTMVLSYITSFFSIKRSYRVMVSGIVITAISLFLAFFFMAINVLSIL